MESAWSSLGKSRGEGLIGGDDCVHGAVGRSRRDGGTAHAAEQPSLKRFVVRRIHADEIGHTAGHDVAENSEAGAENGFRFELPRNRHSAVAEWRAGVDENRCAEMSLNGGVQRLIDIMRMEPKEPRRRAIWSCGFSGLELKVSRKPNVQVSVAGHSPGVLRVEIEIEEIEGFIRRRGTSSSQWIATPSMNCGRFVYVTVGTVPSPKS